MSTLKVKFLQMKTMATLNLAAATLLALATLGNCQLSRGPFIPRPSRPATPNEVAPLILVKEPVTIVPREHTPLFPFLGIIPGAKQCGGSGKFDIWRYEACVHSNPLNPTGLCSVPAGPTFSGEMVFTAKETFKGVRILTVLVDVENGNEVFRSPPTWTDITVEAGKDYEICSNNAVSQMYRGKVIKGQFLVYRASGDMGLEVCAEMMYKVV